MIGDREHDVIAAVRNGMRAIGVTWGYGSADELTAAGATMLCESPQQLAGTVQSALESPTREVRLRDDAQGDDHICGSAGGEPTTLGASRPRSRF